MVSMDRLLDCLQRGSRPATGSADFQVRTLFSAFTLSFSSVRSADDCRVYYPSDGRAHGGLSRISDKVPPLHYLS